MSTAVRLRGRLPDGDVNGLAMCGAELRNDPGTMVLIALVAPVAIAQNLETGDEVVSLGIEHAELTGSAEARELLRRLYSDRTGVLELDLTTGDGIVAAVAEAVIAEAINLNVDGVTVDVVDRTTGEITRRRGKAPK